MKLTATTREKETKTYELHNAGLSPAIVYGKGIKENILVSVIEKELRKIFKDIKNKEEFTLDIAGTDYTVVMQDIQVHAVNERVLNVDFFVK